VNVLVRQHIACEPPGVFEDVLLEWGTQIIRLDQHLEGFEIAAPAAPWLS
jgi:hypothetical protein